MQKDISPQTDVFLCIYLYNSREESLMCMEHITELIVALTPLLLGLYASHCTLKKQINSNNGDAARQTEEVKKLLESYKEITRSD